MSQIIADDRLKEQLKDFKEEVEIREASSGRVLGQFLPQAEYRKLVIAWAKTLYTEEELDRAEAEARSMPFKTLDQVLKELGRA